MYKSFRVYARTSTRAHIHVNKQYLFRNEYRWLLWIELLVVPLHVPHIVSLLVDTYVHSFLNLPAMSSVCSLLLVSQSLVWIEWINSCCLLYFLLLALYLALELIWGSQHKTSKRMDQNLSRGTYAAGRMHAQCAGLNQMSLSLHISVR